MKFDRKRAVVVGGSKGLGLTLVKALAEAGSDVVVLSRSAGQLGSVQREFPRVTFVATDIGDADSVANAFVRIRETLGGIDFLILNAALAVPAVLEDMSNSVIRTQLDVNVAGPIYCLREAAPLMQEGMAIFISSESVFDPFPMLTLYAAVKSAIETFVKGIRAEFYRNGKNRIVTFRVGSMADTEFVSSWPQAQQEKFLAVVMETGHFQRSGSRMPTADVAAAILQILGTPASANIDTIDFRSATHN
jgi:NAD(P)-dependent dehydrogenase (short-subunit alcohol dehydrogenase family)